jgi:hypothetical protein
MKHACNSDRENTAVEKFCQRNLDKFTKMMIKRLMYNRLKPSGNYMYHQVFNIHKFNTIPAQCFKVFYFNTL